MEWKTLQSKVHGLNLNDLIKEEFLKKLNDEFDNRDIDIVTIQIAIRDKLEEPSDDVNLDVISLSNNTIEDTLLNNTIVDVNSIENYEKIKKVLDE
ncbi:hypothetical protein [Methanobrevibacter olleyae]|uniref:Uncharacterized protein n=1 Tax=Methanobrevibacter olleyae TaxID=294671 RepID=A0A126QZE8_METOL|nr:hypothetical protein [Methanobrevibacter olleyae]AMK15172.1 hypothetical protein YLM1_0615 [Methanobrevibacter olleyae]SFL45597.1 hypothetical protein SAMN02910297_00928 [Methanobrevibacter olleyae]